MFRSIFAVVLGYAALASGSGLLLWLGLAPDPSAPLATEGTLIGLALRFATAVVGGWLTAMIAPGRRWRHIQIVVVLVLLAAAIQLLWSRGQMSLAYELVALGAVVAGVFVGGSLKPGNRL